MGNFEAILSLVPDAIIIERDGIVEWINPSTPPITEEQIAVELARLQAEFESKEYQRQRVLEYPSIGDQLDALFKAGVFPADMAAKIQAVKDKYPKV